jgi:molybdate transport system substrate-binding protein
MRIDSPRGAGWQPRLSTSPLSNFSASLSRYAAIFLIFLFFPQQASTELLVAAAADLAPLQASLTQGFAKVSTEKLTFTFGSSGMLARQIEHGAPYDVYLSANQAFVDELIASGHVTADSLRRYAVGRLALWSKRGDLRSVSDLGSASVRHVALPNPRHAPYGMAAKELLEKQGLWDVLEPKVIYAQNVRQAFEFADSGNADAVITAWTMVFGKGGILLSDEWHAPIIQAAGIVRRSPRQDAAARFLEFLTGKDGLRILTENGLFPPTPSGAPGRRPPSGR